jgi:Leucine-rich repeat (LRR) protein
VLRVNDNYLDSFPEQTFSMPMLQQLDISQNRISSIPLAAFQFTDMQLLGLKNNPWSKETKALIAMESKKLKERQIVVLIDTDND